MFRRYQIVQDIVTGSEFEILSRDAHRNFGGNLYCSEGEFEGRHVRPMSVAYYLCGNIATGETLIKRHEELVFSPDQTKGPNYD